jgi:hypothetical protein
MMICQFTNYLGQPYAMSQRVHAEILGLWPGIN